jgi:Na+-transporting NADH:ubiquinone oxidoreductase subunit NqrB
VERHIRILAILSRVWGALAALIGVSMFVLALGAASLLLGPQGAAVELAAGLTAGLFALASLVALLWGGASLWSAARISRHEPLGRTVGLALGVVNLLVLPFGTALGAYALWVLLAHEGRRHFVPAAVS